MSPLVVTGASGRIGAMLRAIWGKDGAVWSGRGAQWPLPWDMTAAPAVALPRGAVILHLAAVIGDDTAAEVANVAFARTLALAARDSGARHVLFASTLAVLGAGGPFAEDAPPAPLRGYGRAKAAAERAVVAALGQGGVPLTILRIGNVVGADALLSPRQLPVQLDPVSGQSGGPVRSWIAPHMLARVLEGLVRLAAGGAGLPDTLNIAADPPLSMADMLNAAGLPHVWAPPRAGTVPLATLDLSRLASLGLCPQATPQSLIADWRSLQGRSS